MQCNRAESVWCALCSVLSFIFLSFFAMDLCVCVCLELHWNQVFHYPSVCNFSFCLPLSLTLYSYNMHYKNVLVFYFNVLALAVDDILLIHSFFPHCYLTLW